MKRALCVVKGCKHAHDDTWTHKPPRREQPVSAHLRVVGRAAA